MSDKKCPVIFKNNCNDCDEKNCNDCYFKIKMGDDEGKYALCRNGWSSCSEKSKVLRSYKFCTKKKRKPRTYSKLSKEEMRNKMAKMAKRDKARLSAVEAANEERLQQALKSSMYRKIGQNHQASITDKKFTEMSSAVREDADKMIEENMEVDFSLANRDASDDAELEKALKTLLNQGGGIKRKTRRRKRKKRRKSRKRRKTRRKKKRKRKRRRTRKK